MFDPIAYINEPRWMESRLGLERTHELLERLGNPQKQLRFVHVAGTNGKGSTCAFLASVLQAAGYKTGLFTSPYIVEFADRIRVDGENISEGDLFDVTLAVKEAADAMADHPTEFELMTAVAFLHFARQECDIVVCEVGMGGRLDSTNVIEAPELCVITQIALDHMGILGDTIAKIAAEKAGIIKQGTPVVSWPQVPEAEEVIKRIAAEKEAPLTTPDFSALQVIASKPDSALLNQMKEFSSPIGVEESQNLPACQEADSKNAMCETLLRTTVSCKTFVRVFDYKQYENLQISLMGSYQPANAAMAIEAVEVLRTRGWSIDDAALRTGLAETRWPARFEIVAQHPTIILDGGHNAEGAKALADSLRENFPGRKAVFLIGLLADKEYGAMIRTMLPLASAFVCFTVPSPRALPAEHLAAAINQTLNRGAIPAENLEESTSIEAAARDSVPSQAGESTALPVETAATIPAAVQRARVIAGEDGIVCACGSLYSIADLKKAIG